ncbi:MAG: FtsW/RodA/SpoVE family cell cycle protein [Clostridia bacterium]|nr:FtsW/RodA/SpoVE family cell cycle protein [Clostridia bacterium]
MPATNKPVQEFLQTICDQIRFKSIHRSIIHELSDHIEEQKNFYMDQGLDEEAATLKAVEEMGDPVMVGKQLDKAHRSKTEWSILTLAAVLVLIGGAVQYFLSGVNENSSYMFSSFLQYAPIGIAAFFLTYFFDYTLLGRFPKFTYIVLFILTVAGFFFVRKTNGAYLHVYYSILLFIPAFAGIIYSYRNKGYVGVIACGLFYIGPATLCVIAPRLSGLILLSIACLITLTVAILKGIFGGNKNVSLALIYIPTMMAVMGFGAFIFQSPYRIARIQTVFFPQLDPRGDGWQLLMIKRILASSQFFGEAVLEGNLANMRIDRILPGWADDLSLTYIIARFGYIAGLIVIFVILVLIVRMFISVNKQRNAYGFLVALSACLAITGQFVFYVLLNLGFMVLFSVTLPFISFGGMSFIVNMILLGLILSVYRCTDLVKDKLEVNTNLKSQSSIYHRRLFSIEDGKLVIDLGVSAYNNMDKNKNDSP